MKFNLLCYYFQAGKTFISINDIHQELDLDYLFGASLHIVCTIKTIVGINQFSSRLSEINNRHGPHSVLSLSSDRLNKKAVKTIR